MIVSKIIFATLATLSFGFLINIKGKKILLATIAGFIGALVFQWCLALGLNSYMATFIAAVLFSIYAEIMAGIIQSTVSTFSLSGLLPIAPGRSLYLSIDSFVKGDWISGQALAINTVINALLLALGILIVGSCFSFIHSKQKNLY